MRLGHGIHIFSPMGVDGNGPFSPVQGEKTRAMQNIKAILMIEPREWPMRPNIGTPIISAIDEPATEVTRKLLQSVIKAQLVRYEPGVDFRQIHVWFLTTTEGVRVQVLIRGVLKKSGDPLNVAVQLQGVSV